jgi:hypothetical protein
VLPADQAGALEKTLPAPDAGPVQGFEQKAAAAVQNIQGADPATKQSLMQWIKQGVSKPETQQLILAAVGAGVGSLISKVGPILSMIPGGGPVAAAVTGAVIAGAVSVASAKMQGKDWKTAFKGAIKPALMGGASAVIGNLATTAISAMTGGNSTPDQAQPPGASVSMGDKMPDGSTVTGLEGGQVTVTRPDGTSETMSNQDYYGRTGQQGIADPNAAPADSDKPKRQLPQWAQDLQDKQKTIDDFANRMGLPPGKHDVQMQGGVPVSIDGQPVPQELYNPQQQRNIQAAQQMSAMNANSAAIQSGENPNADTFRKQAQDQVALNQRMQTQTDAGGIGKNFDAGIAPIGANGQPMRAVPMDEPTIGSNFNAGIAPIGANGQPMRAVPMDEPATGRMPGETPPGINRLTGKPFEPAPAWDQMTPDQQAAVTARQQQQAADAAAGAQNAKDYWANKNPNTRGLKESFAESKYVDKQATLRKWLVQESKGQRIHGLQLKATVKEGIMDSIKGMFGGGKKGVAPAAGGVTADALNKAWATAGSPTDSEEVAKVLQSAGVPAETVTKVFADLKLPPPGSPETSAEEPAKPGETPAPTEPEAPAAGKVNIDELVAQINKLAPADKQKIIAALQG